MPVSMRPLVLPFAAFLVGLTALAVALFSLSGPGQRGAAAIGGSFTLVDQNGRAVADKDFEGAPYLVFFGFTHCPDVCPTTLNDITQVLAALGGDGASLRALFVSVDPERDTPEALKAYLDSFSPRIVGLTGSPGQIEAMTKAYKVYARKVPLKGGDYTMDHTALVYLMDKQGHFVGSFNPKRPAAEAAAELRRYL